MRLLESIQTCHQSVLIFSKGPAHIIKFFSILFYMLTFLFWRCLTLPDSVKIIECFLRPPKAKHVSGIRVEQGFFEQGCKCSFFFHDAVRILRHPRAQEVQYKYRKKVLIQGIDDCSLKDNHTRVKVGKGIWAHW